MTRTHVVNKLKFLSRVNNLLLSDEDIQREMDKISKLLEDTGKTFWDVESITYKSECFRVKVFTIHSLKIGD